MTVTAVAVATTTAAAAAVQEQIVGRHLHGHDVMGEGPDHLSELVDLVAQVPDAGVAFVQPVFQAGDVLVFFPGLGRPAGQLALQVPQSVHHGRAHRDRVERRAGVTRRGRLSGRTERACNGRGDFARSDTAARAGTTMNRLRRVTVRNTRRTTSALRAAAVYCRPFRVSRAPATTGSRLRPLQNDDQFQFRTRARAATVWPQTAQGPPVVMRARKPATAAAEPFVSPGQRETRRRRERTPIVRTARSKLGFTDFDFRR